MKIHVLGASGSGVTTLGEATAEALECSYYDSDAYFWLATDPPFTHRRRPAERNESLRLDLHRSTSWVLGGSIIDWGEEWLTLFDLVVFLWLPTDLRMERLRQRELERYGEVIYTNLQRNEQYQQFLAWAARYDDNTARGRTWQAQQAWLAKVACPVLRLEGDLSVTDRLERVLATLKELT